MTTNPPFGTPPTVEAHLSGAESYDRVQSWVFQRLAEPDFAVSTSPSITVSISRGYDGRWHGHVYGWPAPPEGAGAVVVTLPANTLRAGDRVLFGADGQMRALDVRGQATVLDLGDIARHKPGAVHEVDVPGQDGAPMIYAGEPVRPVPVVPGPEDRRRWPTPQAFNAAFGFDSALRAAADADAAQRRRAVIDGTYVGEGTAYGINSVTGVPVPTNATGSFFVPNPADAPPPLELDLDTEAPKREGRRSRRERERREAAEAAADAAVAAAEAAARASVPPSGHRPDGNGVAPVEYPLCVSQIDTNEGRKTCKRRHVPGAPRTNLTHSVDGFVWKDGDARSPIND